MTEDSPTYGVVKSDSGRMMLHASSLQMFSRCQVQFEFRYIQGLKRPPGIAMVVGSGTHAGIEHNMKTKLETGRLAERGEAEAKAEALIKEKFAEGVALDEEEKGVDIKKLRGLAEEKARRLYGAHHLTVAPNVKPVAVERAWVLKMPDEPMDLQGKIDLQEAERLRDAKTHGAKTPPVGESANLIAADAYCMAVLLTDGVLPEEFAVDHLVDTKTPKAVTHYVPKTMKDIEQFAKRLKTIMASIKAGNFVPFDASIGGQWVCSKRFCGYYDSICPYARNPVSVRVSDAKGEE